MKSSGNYFYAFRSPLCIHLFGKKKNKKQKIKRIELVSSICFNLLFRMCSLFCFCFFFKDTDLIKVKVKTTRLIQHRATKL
jgi:hypothetical protein